MQEHNFRIQEALQNGLRKEVTPAANVSYLDRAENLIPREGGIASPPSIARPGALQTYSTKNFPFPMVFKGDSVRLLFGESEVRTLNSSFTASSALTLNLRGGGTGSITVGGPWHCETFMDQWIATNGTSLVYKIPSDDGDAYIADTCAVQALGRHDYRLVAAGLSGTWFAGTRWETVFEVWRETHVGQLFVHDGLTAGASYVVYGEVGGGAVDVPLHAMACVLGLMGDTAFDAAEEVIWDSIERGDIGLVPIRKVSNIRTVKQLGRRVIVYGDNAISELTPFEGGFQETLVCDFGVGGRCCVGGDDRRHVFVDNDGELCSFYANQDRPERQGYASFLSALDFTKTVVSHDPVEGYFWITDGTNCYVLGRTGLGGPMTTHPSSLFRDGTYGLVGSYNTPRTSEWLLRTAPFNMGHRDSKHIILVQVLGSGYNDATAQSVGTYDHTGATIESPVAPINTHGVAFPALSFVEGWIDFAGSGSAVDIAAIEVRYQAEGRIYRRGTAGVPDGD